MSEVTDAINTAEAALETAKAEAVRAEELTQLVSAAPLVEKVAIAQAIALGAAAPVISVSREEFEAMREELNILNARIADFNQRSGQRI